MARSAASQLDEALAATPAVAMATLIAAAGSTPKKAGARMWVDAAGSTHGTVTIGGCVDARVLEAAAEVLADGAPRRLDLQLGDEDAWEIGLTCGGSVEVLVERVARDDAAHTAFREVDRLTSRGETAVVMMPADGGARTVLPASEAPEVARDGISRVVEIEGTRQYVEIVSPPRRVLIIGGSEVARSLVAILAELGMDSVVIDARDRLVTEARFPLATERLAGIPSEIVAAQPLTPATSIVLVAHDHKYELPVLRHVLRVTVGYIGVLGGRRRADALRAMLRDDGFTDDELARIHMPIGLDIGARTTAEIALSVAAELVAVATGRRA